MLSRIEANLSSFKPAINKLPERRASVLIPLLEREGQTLLLLTKRSKKLRSHSGQVSFPGGKQDEQDQSSLDTALREAREEIGLESKSVRILGCLDQIISLHFYLVTPLCRFDPFKI
jgi:NTP pyrophosphohydrolases including oxidative damage repair enzymes